jgi:ATP-dependent helicase HrpB
MLIEGVQRHCVAAAALCAALVSGRDLLMRLSRDDKHIAEAREPFEASPESDFFRLILAYQFARERNFDLAQCRRYGIHAQTARQVEQTYEQILQIAQGQGLLRKESASDPSSSQGIAGADVRAANDALRRCIMSGFIDQLCVRRDRGSLECDLTEGRQGTLMRESVVQDAPLLVAASIREVESRGAARLTLLGLATAVQREWLDEMYPQHLSSQVQHLYDRTHKRVAAIRVVRFLDVIIQQEHQREVDPVASAHALADAYLQGWFELPLFNHEIKQFVARVNLVARASPDLDLPPLNRQGIELSLARAFHGLTLAKEAQAVPLREPFRQHLPREQLEWIDELAPGQIVWPDGRKMKLLYIDQADEPGDAIALPELQVKLHECFALQEHPRVCEGKAAVKLWLCGPDGKRLESTNDWPAFRAGQYPKLKAMLQKRYPGVPWL